ncbi:hypothetical protein BB561_000692 [Smittium simulii]|uniref:assimilatory sulfite reductase (NADPH) n=1 Tax=Smittium simulii TaxID=133385 RepID=A0A2T9YXY9_9FUNG|nr:hypothetical protein BB561_000692 [Smittium simulii]
MSAVTSQNILSKNNELYIDSSHSSPLMQTRVNSSLVLQKLDSTSFVSVDPTTDIIAQPTDVGLDQLKINHKITFSAAKIAVSAVAAAYSDIIFDYTDASTPNAAKCDFSLACPSLFTLAHNSTLNVFGRAVVPITTDTRSHAGLSAIGSLDQGTIVSIITKSDTLKYFKHNLTKYSSKIRGTVFHIDSEFVDNRNILCTDTESVFGFDHINPTIIFSSTVDQAKDYAVMAHALAKITNSCVFHVFNSTLPAQDLNASTLPNTPQIPDLYYFRTTFDLLTRNKHDYKNPSDAISAVFSAYNSLSNTNYSPISSFGSETAKVAFVCLGLPQSGFNFTRDLPQFYQNDSLFINISAYTDWSLTSILNAISPSVETVYIVASNPLKDSSRLYADILVTFYTLPGLKKNIHFELKNIFGFKSNEVLEWVANTIKHISPSAEDYNTENNTSSSLDAILGSQTQDQKQVGLDINEEINNDPNLQIESSLFRESNILEIQKSIVFKDSYKTDFIFDTESENLYSVKLVKFIRLTPESYERNIFHLEFDTTKSDLKYDIGDALGVCGENNQQDVIDFLTWYNQNPNELLTREINGTCFTKTAHQWFKQKIDIFGRPNKQFYSYLASHAQDSTESKALEWIVSNEGKDEFKRRTDNTTTFADLLFEFKSARPPITSLLNNIPLIKQRHYSISSSSNMHPNKVHLLIVLVDWEISGKPKKYGLCTKYLSDLKIGNDIIVSVKKSAMKLPENDLSPVIMAGLGTGMAPFKAFIEERTYRKSLGIEVGPMALYFGSRSRFMEYLYAEDLEVYNSTDGVLSVLRLAFSRDQPEKVYIQHKLAADSELLCDWLFKKSGSFYLCGPTWPVPNVKEALVQSFIDFGSMNTKKANKFIEELKEKERYVLEVY